MRLGVALGATASVVAISLGIVSVGRHLAGDDASPVAVEAEMAEPPDPGPEKTARVGEPGSEPLDSPFVSGRRLPKDAAGYQRIEPRAPLSKLGQAQPPPQKMSNDWEGTNLYRPVVNAAGVFEAMGYTVTVAGTDIVDAQETCVFRGKSWPCGVLARTAFRSFLRGRAVTCALPSDSETLTASSVENTRKRKNPAQGDDPKRLPPTQDTKVAAHCRIGKQNVGEWLVSNGWARAAENGPYADAGKKAQSAAKGIFGPPPPSLQ
jgi:endonuclease YncB( thermonuclease family)